MEASTNPNPSESTTLHSHFHRSLSPSGRLCSSSSISASPRHEPILVRATSPTRVSLGRSVSPSSSVKLSASPSHHHHRNLSPKRLNPSQKKTCMCSPTTHPRSFRCSLHKNRLSLRYANNQATSYRSSHQLNMRRSAMTNSLVRIGTVEGDLLRRALAALIRPSSHSLRRRADFVPRRSRLSVMSRADGM